MGFNFKRGFNFKLDLRLRLGFIFKPGSKLKLDLKLNLKLTLSTKNVLELEPKGGTSVLSSSFGLGVGVRVPNRLCLVFGIEFRLEREFEFELNLNSLL